MAFVNSVDSENENDTGDLKDRSPRTVGRRSSNPDPEEDSCELCGAPVLDVQGCATCGHDILCDSCLTDHDCPEGFGWDE